MAFPTYAGATTTAKSTAGTSHAITLPSSSSGDVLVAIFGTDQAPTHTWPSDWADAVFAYAANGSECSVSGRWKISDGSETLTITTGSSVQSAAQVLRFTAGFSSVTPVVGGATVTGSSTNPNPPACTPGGSAQDFFWVSGFLADDDDDTALYFTSGYTGIGQVQSNTASADSCMLSMQYIQNNNTTNNPGLMAMGASEEWIAFNFAISPVTLTSSNTASIPVKAVAVDKYAPSFNTTEKHFSALPVKAVAVASLAPGATTTTTDSNTSALPLKAVAVDSYPPNAATTERHFSSLPSKDLVLVPFEISAETTEPGGHISAIPTALISLEAFAISAESTEPSTDSHDPGIIDRREDEALAQYLLKKRKPKLSAKLKKDSIREKLERNFKGKEAEKAHEILEELIGDDLVDTQRIVANKKKVQMLMALIMLDEDEENEQEVQQ